MSEAKFTPGPWEFAHAGEGRKDGSFAITEYFVRLPGDDCAIAEDIYDPIACRPSEANARLISAAPDLLEALQVVMNYPDVRSYLGSIISNQADAAISRATGGK